MIGRDVQTLNRGQIAWVSIESLLDLPSSIDTEVYREDGDGPHWFFDVMHPIITSDGEYDRVLSAMRVSGQRTECTVVLTSEPGETDYLIFGDGHHRLSAAYTLGWDTLYVRHAGHVHTPDRLLAVEGSGDWDMTPEEYEQYLEETSAFSL